MVNVTWVYPELFLSFIPRLGGMHMLMSFVSCVGTFMANSGLEDVLESAFGGTSYREEFPTECQGFKNAL